ncbi:MAG: indole-3-glycerol phosphate synthase TrpC [Clostridiales bacterium]|nr:indole-3-glycerol phosphate synthase TrpC [Clostridiales bacterium]
MILDKIVEDKKIRLAEHKARISPQDMRRMAEEYDGILPSFREGLMKPGISIIGEFKKASPSLGRITSKIDLTDRIGEYNDSVDCISCLTEEDHFLGNVDYLKEIRALSPLPILRKDFMIDEYQFFEAKAIGANAILLITGILDDVQLQDFYQLTTELGLDALFEAHDESQMDRALRCGAQIVGVNNRDLRDFSIHLETTKVLSKMVPEDRTFVAESGIVSDADVAFLAECRVDAFLIGRAFMESENPRRLAKRWKEVYEEQMNGI